MHSSREATRCVVTPLEPRRLLAAIVIDQHLFYNNSAYDGYQPGAGSSDDAAIAIDKAALRPGETASFANYSSYSRGINGVMIDVIGLAGTPTAADFTFRIGNNNDPNTWSAAPAPQQIAVRHGAGNSASSRVSIVWADQAIQKQWLMVTVLPTDRTGLISPYTFYFGNAIGETGNSNTEALVNAADELLTRQYPHSPINPAEIDDPYDFNRDRLVNAQDQLLTRNHRTSPLTVMWLIDAPPSTSQPLHLRPEAIEAENQLLAIRKTDTPQQIYDAFSKFSRTHFGAEADPLVYEKFGNSLQIIDASTWRHVSENSAALSWTTNLPALSYVEYGLTPSYGQWTTPADRAYSTHAHQLRGLETGKTYHYRLVAYDERGNRFESPNQTFTTAPIANAIYLYQKADGSPHQLDQTGRTYVLKQDLVVAGTAIRTLRDNITIDLNGHSITYAQGATSTSEAHGIWAYGSHLTSLSEVPYQATNLKIFNGTIIQGTGSALSANTNSYNFNALKLSGKNIEVAGVQVIHHAPQAWAVQMNHSRGNIHLHHNTIQDMGATITDRNGSASRSIGFRYPVDVANNFQIDHNLIKRARQNGIGGADRMFNNEIYIDSWSTNSFAIQPLSEVGIDSGTHTGNRIFATGFNPYGFGWAHENLNIEDNVIHMFGLDTTYRWHETWGDVNMLAGMRVTNYGSGGQVRNDLHYSDNLILMFGKQGSQLEGTRFFSDTTISGLVFENNVIKVEALDAQTRLAAAVVVQGHFRKEDSLPVYYRDSRLISNTTIVQFGDSYSKGNNHHFERVSFERIGNNPNFHTFIFGGTYWNGGHVILDGTFDGGAAIDDVYWDATSTLSNYAIQWTLDLQTTPGAEVVIRNASGAIEFSGIAGADGRVRAPLTQGTIRPADWLPTHNPNNQHGVRLKDQYQLVAATPHTVKIVVSGVEVSTEIVMDRRRELTLAPSGSLFMAARSPTPTSSRTAVEEDERELIRSILV